VGVAIIRGSASAVTVGVALVSCGALTTGSTSKGTLARAGAATDEVTRDGAGVSIAVGSVSAGNGGAAGVALVVGSAGITGGTGETSSAGAGAAIHNITRDTQGVPVAVHGVRAQDRGAVRPSSVSIGTHLAARSGKPGGAVTDAAGAMVSGDGGSAAVTVQFGADLVAGGVGSVLDGAGVASLTCIAGSASARAAVYNIAREGGSVSVAVRGVSAGNGGAAGVALVVGGAGIAGGASVAGSAGAGAASLVSADDTVVVAVGLSTGGAAGGVAGTVASGANLAASSGVAVSTADLSAVAAAGDILGVKVAVLVHDVVNVVIPVTAAAAAVATAVASCAGDRSPAFNRGVAVACGSAGAKQSRAGSTSPSVSTLAGAAVNLIADSDTIVAVVGAL